MEKWKAKNAFHFHTAHYGDEAYISLSRCATLAISLVQIIGQAKTRSMPC